MRYARARFEDYKDEYIFRVYISDSINMIPDQRKLVDRYSEIIKPKIEDKRSGDEIAFDVIQNLGLRLNE